MTAFRTFADQVAGGLVLRPLVESYLVRAKFPKHFVVEFHDEGQPRRPDDLFHPSTHPMMPERKLYYYLTEPESWLAEDLAYENRMAILMGTAVHSFMQVCMIADGILLKPTGTCALCKREHGSKKGQCDEFGVFDPVLGRGGHMDGILDIPAWGRGLFEFKTINPRAANGLTDNNLTWLIEKHPDYLHQILEYLEMTGMAKAIILFAVLGFPWKLVEIQVDYDHVRAELTKAKYRRVREHVADGTIPDPCCGPGSKEAKQCEARNVCVIGRMR